MLSTALWSRYRLVPQSGQECQRTERPFCTIIPQFGPEHFWLVNAGWTACTRFPAFAALKVRMARNPPHGVGDTLGQVVVLRHVGNPQVFMVDHVVRLHKGASCFVMKVTPLPCDMLLHAAAPSPRASPLCASGGSLSCVGRHAAGSGADGLLPRDSTQGCRSATRWPRSQRTLAPGRSRCPGLSTARRVPAHRRKRSPHTTHPPPERW